MNKIVDNSDNIIAQYESKYEDISNTLSPADWDSIRYGMNQVCLSKSYFNNFSINVAGKTGTAQQVSTRPNHALFVGYAPYENPEISIATRIAFGYTSHNAADYARNVLSYYFDVEDADELLNGQAEAVDSSSNAVND